MVRAALALAALVVLAGCGGAVSTPAPSTPAAADGSSASTSTPRATATPTEAGPRLPPGVRNDSVDVDKLLRAHRGSLFRASKTVTVERSVVTENGTTLAFTRTEIRSHGDRVAIHQVIRGTDPGAVGIRPANFTYWTAGDETATRRVLADGSVTYSYVRVDGPQQVTLDPTGGDWILGALEGRDVNVTGTVRRANLTLYVIEASANRVTSVRGEVRRNLSLTVYVSRLGIVRSFQLRYETTVDGRPVTVRQTFRLSDFADTPVPRPDWIDEARNETVGSAPATP